MPDTGETAARTDKLSNSGIPEGQSLRVLAEAAELLRMRVRLNPTPPIKSGVDSAKATPEWEDTKGAIYLFQQHLYDALELLRDYPLLGTLLSMQVKQLHHTEGESARPDTHNPIL